MNLTDFTRILQNSEMISEEQTNGVKSIINSFPYFQPARAIYLKGLKKQKSKQYNQELKITASFTTDRSVLFDYITLDTFRQNEVSKFIQQKTSSNKLKENTATLIENKKQETSAEETLKLGSPILFNKTEKHSFNEWLKLTRLSPIVRELSKTEQPNSKFPKRTKKEEKFNLIDKFISENPKINPVKGSTSKGNLAEDQMLSPESLMTETLARIYVEQKNYKKAIQSYKILSLKYPEKSSFFASQIEAVNKLQDKNNQ